MSKEMLWNIVLPTVYPRRAGSKTEKVPGERRTADPLHTRGRICYPYMYCLGTRPERVSDPLRRRLGGKIHKKKGEEVGSGQGGVLSQGQG